MQCIFRFIIFSSLLILCIPETEAFLSDNNVSERWSSVISSGSLKSVSDFIKISSDSSWPHMPSIKKMMSVHRDIASDTTTTRIQLAEHFLASVTAFADAVASDLKVQSLSAPSVCNSLSEIVRRSGGISNLAISDSPDRLVLANLVSSVIERPYQSEFHQRVLELLHIPPVDPQVLHGIAIEEGEAPPDISGLLPAAALWKMLIPTDKGNRDLFKPRDIVFGGPTRALVTEGHSASLVWRLISTRKIHGKILPALINFTAKGGDVNAITKMTNAEFVSFFGSDEINLFRFDELGETSVTVGEIRVLLKDFEKGWKSSIFYQLVVHNEVPLRQE